MPVSSIGGKLNAMMYATPITVPGMAKESIVENSNASFPANFWRTNKYAVSSPTAAVSGAAIAEIPVEKEA